MSHALEHFAAFFQTLQVAWSCVSVAVNIFGIITNLFLRIEEKFAWAVHVFKLNPIRTKVVGVALVRYRIDSILTIVGSFTVHVGGRFASYCLLRKLKSIGAPLVGKLDTIGALIESVTCPFDTVESVFTWCLRWWLRWWTSRERKTFHDTLKMTTSRVFAVFVTPAGRWRIRGGLFGSCLSSAIDILWPVAYIYCRIEKQSLRTVHCLMLVSVRAHEIRIALIGIGIDSVWAEIRRSVALYVSRMFAPV